MTETAYHTYFTFKLSHSNKGRQGLSGNCVWRGGPNFVTIRGVFSRKQKRGAVRSCSTAKVALNNIRH